MRLFFLILLLGAFAGVSAQNVPHIKWEQSLGGSGNDRASAILETSDGGFVIAGTVGSNDGDISGNHGGDDVWIVKFDSTKSIVWKKCFGGTGDERVASMINGLEDYDGQPYFFLAGTTTSDTIRFNGTLYWNNGTLHWANGKSDIWWTGVSSSGEILSAYGLVCFGGTGDDEATSIIQAYGSHYMITTSSNSPLSGNKSDTSRGGKDYWIVRTANYPYTDGWWWEKGYGGGGDDIASAIAATGAPDGGYIIAGTSSSGFASGYKSDPSKGGNDFWIIRTDSFGRYIWDKTYGGSGNDSLYTMVRTSDGMYIAVGISTSEDGDVTGGYHGNKNIWVIKFDSSGHIAWQQCFGGTGDDEPASIAEAPDGGYVIAATSASGISGHKSTPSKGGTDFWLFKIDASGNYLWDNSYGGSGNDRALAMTPLTKGGYLIAGASESNDGDVRSGNKGNQDIWIIYVSDSEESMAVPEVEPEQEAFTLYPNPTSGTITIAFDRMPQEPLHCRVTNTSGALLMQRVITGQTTEVHMDYPAGIYLLHLSNAKQQVIKKIILYR